MSAFTEMLEWLNNKPELEVTFLFVGVLRRLGGDAEIAELETIADEEFVWPERQLNKMLWHIINFRVYWDARRGDPSQGICDFIWEVKRGDASVRYHSLVRAVARSLEY